jgi:flagellar basal body rod protein FlgC
MAGRPKIEIDHVKFVEMYSEDGTKLSVMAAYFGVSIAKIRTVRDEHNLPLRRKKVVYDINEFKQLFNDGISIQIWRNNWECHGAQ